MKLWQWFKHHRQVTRRLVILAVVLPPLIGVTQSQKAPSRPDQIRKLRRILIP